MPGIEFSTGKRLCSILDDSQYHSILSLQRVGRAPHASLTELSLLKGYKAAIERFFETKTEEQSGFALSCV